MTEILAENNDTDHLDLVADIVAAFVGHNTVAATELPALIQSVHAALSRLAAPAKETIEELKPAVPVKRSVTADFIICLEDGRRFKSLKRHLRTAYDLTPEAYREKWGLPRDYPMVAPGYAAARSELAKASGLGQVRKKPAAPVKKAPGRRKAPAA
ncbi:MucR family transcriptional regulator [Xanthobacter oligotrophicus]|uniref:MucR family transcriptional regulator n=1 Tax=Xanthobacter oligotrophicus TaxID=2607286 RepID=A0ABW6ZZQ2_9HYPH